MKALLFRFLLFTFLFSSCGKKRDSGILTFTLERSDFVERLFVPGAVQAVVNFPVVPPRSMFGQMTVLRLAKDGEHVYKGDTICVLTVPDLETMHESIKTSIERLEAEIQRKKADNDMNIALLESQLATSEAGLKISSIDSLRMTYASESQKKLYALEIRKSMIEMQKTAKKLEMSKAIGANEIRQLNMRLVQERTRLQSMDEQINAMTIIAQREGIVMRTESPVFTIMGPQGLGKLGGPITEGSVLFLGTPILQFPDLSRMQVNAEVAETDFRKIEKGQKVNIIVDAAEKLATTGKVNRKGLIGRTAQRYSESKVKLYEIIIDIDSCHNKMKPGLSASCEIIISEARDTVFVPNMALFTRDSASVVYVSGGKKFRPVKVKTGTAGTAFTIITEGLRGDEVIALSEPPENLVAAAADHREKKDSINNRQIKTHQPK